MVSDVPPSMKPSELSFRSIASCNPGDDPANCFCGYVIVRAAAGVEEVVDNFCTGSCVAPQMFSPKEIEALEVPEECYYLRCCV